MIFRREAPLDFVFWFLLLLKSWSMTSFLWARLMLTHQSSWSFLATSQFLNRFGIFFETAWWLSPHFLDRAVVRFRPDNSFFATTMASWRVLDIEHLKPVSWIDWVVTWKLWSQDPSNLFLELQLLALSEKRTLPCHSGFGQCSKWIHMGSRVFCRAAALQGMLSWDISSPFSTKLVDASVGAPSPQ